MLPDRVSNKIKLKLHLSSFYPSTLYIVTFSCFTEKLKEKVGRLLGGGGGGAKGMLPPPLSNYCGRGLTPLLPPTLFLRL